MRRCNNPLLTPGRCLNFGFFVSHWGHVYAFSVVCPDGRLSIMRRLWNGTGWKMVTAMNESLNGWAQRNAFGAIVVLIIRTVCVAVGLALIALAVPIGFLTPFIPIGLPTGLLGLVLVAAASKTLHTYITNTLRRFPWVWKRVRFAFGEKEPAE